MRLPVSPRLQRNQIVAGAAVLLLALAIWPWLAPTAPQYGCTGLIEPGDPVVGVWYPLAGNSDAGSNGYWHPEDEVFLNWFARNGQDPSLGSWDGRYTFMGPLTTGIDPAFGDYSGFASPAQGC